MTTGLYTGELDKDRNPCGIGIVKNADFTQEQFTFKDKLPCFGKQLES